MTANGSSPALPFAADVAFQVGDIAFATDRSGCVVYWNKEAEVVTGYKVEEVLGKPYAFGCRIEPEGAALDISAILAGRDFAGGVRCRSRSGGEVVLYLFATAGRDSAGTTAGVVFVGRDVTGLWQAEEAALASTDKYRVLFENTLDAVAIADMEGKVLEANPACLRLFGLSVEEIRRTHLADAVAPEDRSAAADAMADLAGGRPVTKIIRMRSKDGTRFVVDLSASVMVVGGERRILAVTRDVTDRVRAEQARSQSERMYRTVFESANDAVLVESVDGRILDVNRHGCELLGYTKAELVKKSVSDLVPAQARAWLPRVTDAILRDKTFRTEAVNVHKSGRHIPVEISASTMELDGRTVVLAIVRDVTERKRAEVALADSENRYRTLFNDSLTGIYRTTPDGRILLANPALLRMLGYDSFAQVAERNLETDGSGPGYKRDEFKRRLEREGRIVGLEVSWQTRDGRTLHVRENAHAVRGQDGAVLYYEGTVEDITDRKAVEQALRQEKELAHRYLEVAGAIMVVLDETGAVKLINQKGYEVLGGTSADIVGRNWFENFVPDRYRAQVRPIFAELMSGNLEPVEYYENPVVTMRGEERLIAWHNALLRDENGRIVGTLSSGEDITDRKAAEQALRESEEKYRSVVERASDGICVVQDGRLKYVNPRLAELAGYAAEELVGTQFFEYLHPDDRASVGDLYRRRLTGEELPSAYTTRFLKRTGETVQVEISAALSVYAGGKADIVLVRDISERLRLARAAEETADELRAVLDNSPGAIVGECDGVLVYANQRYARLLGYDSAADIIGRTGADFDAPEDRELMTSYTRLREQGKDAPTSYSFHGLRRDGTILPLEATISTYRSLGRLHVLAFIREVEPGRGGS